jgi:hypothetical protein
MFISYVQYQEYMFMSAGRCKYISQCSPTPLDLEKKGKLKREGNLLHIN